MDELVSPKDRTSLILDNRLFLLAGEIDSENLYPSAVMVLMDDHEKVGISCSGVAISRRVILTAGHCVCARRKQEPPEGEGGVIIYRDPRLPGLAAKRDPTCGVTMRWILAVVLLGSGCLASAPIPDEPPRRYVPVAIQPELGDSIVSNSGVDTQNIYLATVLVEGGRGTCSGVLIAPRIVLTAGHCVCSPRAVLLGEGRGGTLIDKATCSRTAMVKVMRGYLSIYRTVKTVNSTGKPGRVALFVSVMECQPHSSIRR